MALTTVRHRTLPELRWELHNRVLHKSPHNQSTPASKRAVGAFRRLIGQVLTASETDSFVRWAYPERPEGEDLSAAMIYALTDWLTGQGIASREASQQIPTRPDYAPTPPDSDPLDYSDSDIQQGNSNDSIADFSDTPDDSTLNVSPNASAELLDWQLSYRKEQATLL